MKKYSYLIKVLFANVNISHHNLKSQLKLTMGLGNGQEIYGKFKTNI